LIKPPNSSNNAFASFREPLDEPPANRSQQLARFLHIALVTPEKLMEDA
jgi:hypothetical protein